MKNIETFQQINKNDTSIHFSIKETNSKSNIPKLNPPHRHDFFTIIVSIKAKGKHIIDFNEYELKENQVFFISPGQVHQVIENQPLEGFAILFSNDFLIKNNISTSFIENLNLFNHYGDSPPIKLNTESKNKLIFFSQEMKQIYNSNSSFKEESIGAYLKLFLIECNYHLRTDLEENKTFKHKSSILIKFKQAVDENYKYHLSISDYATKLNISSDHLNRTIKSLTGKTTKQYIQTRINIASKRLLFFSELSTKEIGFELGFTEASNFSTFFKKLNNMTPSEFKKNKNIVF